MLLSKDGGDIGLQIVLVPKVLKLVLSFIGLKTLGTFMNLDGWF